MFHNHTRPRHFRSISPIQVGPASRPKQANLGIVWAQIRILREKKKPPGLGPGRAWVGAWPGTPNLNPAVVKKMDHDSKKKHVYSFALTRILRLLGTQSSQFLATPDRWHRSIDGRQGSGIGVQSNNGLTSRKMSLVLQLQHAALMWWNLTTKFWSESMI